MNAKLEHAISKTLSDISESTYMNDDEDRVEMNVRVRGYFKGLNLIEAPAKVVVSEEEADKLERAKVYGNPADVILALAANHHPDDAEHILRAYVNGWTVEKPKRWSVKVPHVNVGWYFINNAGNLSATYQPADAGQFTLDEIEHYGLGDCEKEEVI